MQPVKHKKVCVAEFLSFTRKHGKNKTNSKVNNCYSFWLLSSSYVDTYRKSTGGLAHAANRVILAKRVAPSGNFPNQPAAAAAVVAKDNALKYETIFEDYFFETGIERDKMFAPRYQTAYTFNPVSHQKEYWVNFTYT